MTRTKEGALLTEIILEIFELSGLLIQEGDILTKDHGLTSARWKVLGALASVELATVSEIARIMGLTRQGVQRLTNELEKSELIYSKVNPKHQNARLFALTKKGKNIFNDLEKKQTVWVNSIANKLKAEDLELTSLVLQKVGKHLVI